MDFAKYDGMLNSILKETSDGVNADKYYDSVGMLLDLFEKEISTITRVDDVTKAINFLNECYPSCVDGDRDKYEWIVSKWNRVRDSLFLLHEKDNDWPEELKRNWARSRAIQAHPAPCITHKCVDGGITAYMVRPYNSGSWYSVIKVDWIPDVQVYPLPFRWPAEHRNVTHIGPKLDSRIISPYKLRMSCYFHWKGHRECWVEFEAQSSDDVNHLVPAYSFIEVSQSVAYSTKWHISSHKLRHFMTYGSIIKYGKYLLLAKTSLDEFYSFRSTSLDRRVAYNRFCMGWDVVGMAYPPNTVRRGKDSFMTVYKLRGSQKRVEIDKFHRLYLPNEEDINYVGVFIVK